MCKVMIDPDGTEEIENIRSVIGWIEEKTIITEQNKMHVLGYKIRWSDRQNQMSITEQEIHRLRNYYLECRQAMGV